MEAAVPVTALVVPAGPVMVSVIPAMAEAIMAPVVPVMEWVTQIMVEAAPVTVLVIQVTGWVIPATAQGIKAMAVARQVEVEAVVAAGQAFRERAPAQVTASGARSRATAGVDPKATAKALATREPDPGRSISVSQGQLAKGGLEARAAFLTPNDQGSSQPALAWWITRRSCSE